MSGISVNWYLPTHGDGRTLTQAGAAMQSLHMGRNAPVSGPDGSAVAAEVGPAPAGVRPATFDYVRQVALAAELAGFDAVLTPTGTWCEDAWVAASSLIPLTSRLRFLVAIRPGTISPTLAAQQAATFQRFSGGRLMLNIVTGAENVEQRRFGDRLDKDDRYNELTSFSPSYVLPGRSLSTIRGSISGSKALMHRAWRRPQRSISADHRKPRWRSRLGTPMCT
jgi:alkanesulfonate monooxygenase